MFRIYTVLVTSLHTLTAVVGFTARDVGPWPFDHCGIQTGPGQTCLLRTGGAVSSTERGISVYLQHVGRL